LCQRSAALSVAGSIKCVPQQRLAVRAVHTQGYLQVHRVGRRPAVSTQKYQLAGGRRAMVSSKHPKLSYIHTLAHAHARPSQVNRTANQKAMGRHQAKTQANDGRAAVSGRCPGPQCNSRSHPVDSGRARGLYACVQCFLHTHTHEHDHTHTHTHSPIFTPPCACKLFTSHKCVCRVLTSCVSPQLVPSSGWR
jgi:hypothetical protein